MVFASGLLLIVLSLIMRIYPPKQINNYYGYRTDLAKSSKRAWHLAQEHSMKMNMSYGLRMLAAGLVTGFFLVLNKYIYAVLAIELFILMPLFTFARNGATDKYLKKKLNR